MSEFTLTQINVQGEPQSAFEVYADETKEQTIAFCFDEPFARLIAAAPKLLAGSQDFLAGWLHFCDCINFSKSNLDAAAIRFMNEVPGKIKQAAIAAAQ